MSIYLHKEHNVSTLIYHLVCPIKYRKEMLTEPVNECIKDVCLALAERYEIHFLEIGMDRDHAHFLIQSIPTLAPFRIAQIVKSITAREAFKRLPEVRKDLWGGAFWTAGYFITTVGRTGSENAVSKYVQAQGNAPAYRSLHSSHPTLFA